MTHLQQFERYRPLLFSIAYRMMGTAMEAEDMLQETYLRYSGTGFDTIQSHKHFLTTVITRLCINKMQSAQAQREQYVGNWLPEPILTDAQPVWGNPSEEVNKLESISMAFMVLLEQLSGAERAVFILREIFDYDYAEIADIVEKSESACRKLFSRAKQHLSDNRPRFERNPQQHQTMLLQFLSAINDGNLDALVNLLAEDAVLVGDGGNKRGAATRPIFTRKNIVAFLNGTRRFYEQLDLYPVIQTINGEPAIVLYQGRDVYSVISVDILNGQVQRIYLIGNEDKLSQFT